MEKDTLVVQVGCWTVRSFLEVLSTGLMLEIMSSICEFTVIIGLNYAT